MPVKNPEEPFTRISAAEAKEMLERDDVAIIDVREPHEYQSGHVPGATLIPVNSVYARRQELPQDKDLIFVCALGQRSALASEMAAAAGLTRIFNLEGGTEAWIKASYPVEK
ncbi:MAG TPA: rhodanese-like domain-containing protein [Dehalococcoidia bacterium]|nr:rhodanese-like domain-containing protein [Dehalococcoidia bacterium]